MEQRFAVVVNGTAVLVLDFECANRAGKIQRSIEGNKVVVRRANDRDVAQAIITLIDLNAQYTNVAIDCSSGRIDTMFRGEYHTLYRESYDVAAIVAHWALTNSARLAGVVIH